MQAEDNEKTPPELRELEELLARRTGLQADRDFRRRVLTAIRGELRRPRPAGRWVVAVAAVAAACLVAIMLFWPGGPRPAPRDRPDAGAAKAIKAADAPAGKLPPPSFLAYRKAMQTSADQFDSLLARHGQVLLPRAPDEPAVMRLH